MTNARARTVVAALSLVLTTLAIGGHHRVVAQSVAMPSGPTFDVVSVKRNASVEAAVSGGFLPGGRYQVRNYPLRSLIAAAYLRPQINPDFLIAGGPAWIDSARFDIDARAAGEFPAGPDGPTAPRRVMLQNLLAERFGLRTHLEKREATIFTLERARADRLGPRLRPAAPDCAAAATSGAPVNPIPVAATAPCAVGIGPGAVTMTRVPIAQLANLLPRFVNRIVVDRTMLDGPVDFELTWTPAPGEWTAPPASAGSLPPAADGPSLVTALEEQLGLRLVAGRAPVDYLVIDAVHLPTEN